MRRPIAAATAILATVAVIGFAPGTATAAPSEVFFSEYIEGSSNNKALEIFNGTGAAIDLAAGGYQVQMAFNGNPTPSLTIGLTGTVANGDVYVLAQSAANATILAQADQTNGSGWFNGDDALGPRKGAPVLHAIGPMGSPARAGGGSAGGGGVLRRTGAPVLDVIGQSGFGPGTEWGSGLQSTADNTLRRKGAIGAGGRDAGGGFDPTRAARRPTIPPLRGPPSPPPPSTASARTPSSATLPSSRAPPLPPAQRACRRHQLSASRSASPSPSRRRRARSPA